MAKPTVSHLDITGRRFGKLTAIYELPREGGRGPRRWMCRCDCGRERSARPTYLHSGTIRSCGCLLRETLLRRNQTHGKSGTPEYRAWCGMRERCRNPRLPAYRDYGGRGITVCPRWESFEAFLADMGPRPSPRHTLERINNDGPYAPRNCRWATRGEQCRNYRRNHHIEHQGRDMLLMAWAEEKGLRLHTLIVRLRRGWSVEQALETPTLPHGKTRG
jgi:hypothetical protein